MKRKLLINGILMLLLSSSGSVAMACNCGKKADGSNQKSSCQDQCSGGCGAHSACSDKSFQLAQVTMPQEAKEAQPAVVEVGNKICPVSGEKVGEMGEIVKHEYNGKIYNLCCKACAKDFKKDPEKYSKIADEEVKNEVKMPDERIGQDDHSDHDHSK